MTGAEALISQLKAREVPFISMLCGNGTEAIIDAAGAADLPLIHTRNEQAASYLAEAYAKLTRRVGVCVVSSGIAHVNGMAGLLNAHYDATPMLLITGHNESHTLHRGGFQDIDHIAMCESFCKHAEQVDRPERIPQAIAECFHAATTGRPGPTHLTIPRDILRGQIADDLPMPSLGRRGKVEQSAAPLQQDAARAAQMIAEARKPLIVAGGGCFYADAGAELLELAELTGAPIVTPIWDRGVINEPTDYFMGVIGAASGEPPLLEEADLLVIAGADVDYRLRYMDRPPLRDDLKVIRIDVDAGRLYQAIAPDIALLGDPKSTFAAIAEAYDGEAHQEWLSQAQEMHADFYSAWNERPAAPEGAMVGWDIARAVAQVLDEQTILAVDGGNIGQWLHMTLCRNSYPEALLTCGASGVIGYGVPGAMAAKLAFPDRRVLLVTGDGSLGFCIPELQSAVRHNTPLVVVVADDEAWGIVVSGQKQRGAACLASELGECGWAQTAMGFGARGVRVEAADDIAPAIEDGFASGQPTLVEVPLAILGPSECRP
ncbi:MAG: thiamine pyrophosphate-binding protein [candidate division WS1 bacterium]|jgi:acetolactate synthase-1/2/3 large subunit|nr:thiamine pyrophosphate-binding protein [candidate division WS1 bacterium]